MLSSWRQATLKMEAAAKRLQPIAMPMAPVAMAIPAYTCNTYLVAADMCAWTCTNNINSCDVRQKIKDEGHEGWDGYVAVCVFPRNIFGRDSYFEHTSRGDYSTFWSLTWAATLANSCHWGDTYTPNLVAQQTPDTDEEIDLQDL